MAAKGSRRLEKAKMARHNEAMIALYEPFMSRHEFSPKLWFGWKIQCPALSSECGGLLAF